MRSRFAIALVGKSSSTLILFVQLVVTTVGAVLALRGDLSAGSLVGLPVAGAVVRRIGTGRTVGVGALLSTGGLAGVGLAVEVAGAAPRFRPELDRRHVTHPERHPRRARPQHYGAEAARYALWAESQALAGAPSFT